MANEMFTDFGTAVSLTGDEVLVGIQSVSNTQFPLNLLAPYKVYIAIISQSGTADPTIDTIINNTFTGAISISRASTGVYSLTSADSEFVSGKTETALTNGINGGGILGSIYNGVTTVSISSRNSAGAVTDGLLQSATLKVLIWS